MLHFVLDDLGNAQACPDLMRWARFMESLHARKLGDSEVNGVRVSTVFLGLDHNYSGHGPPVLWETMIFGGEHDGWQWRYTSRRDAEVGHHAVIAWLQGPRGRARMTPDEADHEGGTGGANAGRKY